MRQVGSLTLLRVLRMLGVERIHLATYGMGLKLQDFLEISLNLIAPNDWRVKEEKGRDR